MITIIRWIALIAIFAGCFAVMAIYYNRNKK